MNPKSISQKRHGSFDNSLKAHAVLNKNNVKSFWKNTIMVGILFTRYVCSCNTDNHSLLTRN